MAIGIIFFADKSASPKFTDRKCSDCGACFREKRRENFFAVAREFFTSRTKTKKFPRHVFQSVEIENYGA